MIERGAHRSILLDDYEQHRTAAEKARQRERDNKAAAHYRQAASLLREIAELEDNETLAKERLSLARNLSNAADTLERTNGQNSGQSGSSRTKNDSIDLENELSQAREEATSDAENYLESPPELDFDDVGGMTELKQTLIDTVVDPLNRPELYDEYNLGVVNGVLLYGPPGTGKTYITRALAGKLGYNFIEVAPSDLTSSLVGEAADKVAELFDIARSNQPCLVFIDEIDAVAGQRSGGAQKTQSERQMVNQLLTELSEIQGEEVVVIAATNLLEAVDDALKRSGRFDERIEVPPPDPTAREAILRVHLRDRPVLTDDIDWEAVRRETEGYTASDMQLVAASAARNALKEARERGEIQPVTQSHLETAIKETEPSLFGDEE
jgi:transitional endoplasmic reticulum ATPase